MADLFHRMDMDQNASIRPAIFLHTMQTLFDFLNIRSQNDVHEIFMLIVAKINTELAIPAPPMELPKKSSPFFDKIRRKCDKSWEECISKEYSPLTNMLHGQMINQIICGNCKHIHHNYQMFSVWEVPIPQSAPNPTLEDCFSMSLASEVINEWKCDKCERISPSEKVMKVWKFPRILTICIKRFVHENRRGFKKTEPINVPEIIDLYPLELSPSNTSLRYHIRSAAIHMGSLNSGHYVAHCRQEDSSWVYIDDEALKRSKSKNADQAYMLFYERV